MLLHNVVPDHAFAARRDIRVMLLTDANDDARLALAMRLKRFSARIDTEDNLFCAVETVQTCSTGYGLFIMDCQPFGGISAARQVLTMLGNCRSTLHIILIGDGIETETFPGDESGLTLLNAPLSNDVLRSALDYATRYRLIWKAA